LIVFKIIKRNFAPSKAGMGIMLEKAKPKDKTAIKLIS